MRHLLAKHSLQLCYNDSPMGLFLPDARLLWNVRRSRTVRAAPRLSQSFSITRCPRPAQATGAWPNDVTPSPTDVTASVFEPLPHAMVYLPCFRALPEECAKIRKMARVITVVEVAGCSLAVRCDDKLWNMKSENLWVWIHSRPNN